jgi:transposase
MSHIQVPLDLPHVRVLKVEARKGGGWTISVESTLKTGRCERCGRENSVFHGYDDWVEVQHLPIFEQAVYIRYRPKRYACPFCEAHPTSQQELSWHRARSPYTKAFEDKLLKALIHSTVTDVSVKEGVSYDSMLGLVERRIRACVDWRRFKRLGIIGLDEVALKKGQRDYAVIVSAYLENGDLALLGVLPDREKATVQAFLESIPPHLKATIHSVCTDMYESYLQAAQAALPNADIIIDRFHLARNYGELAEKVRKAELRRLKKELPAEQYTTLKGAHLVFRKHRKALNETQKALLERLFSYAPTLRLVYTFREGLFAIFEKSLTVEQAQAELKAWMFLVREQSITAFIPFLDTLERYWTPITNFFKRRLTSGFIEGLNNKIRVLTRRCFALFNLAHFFQRLWLDLEGYRAFGCTH